MKFFKCNVFHKATFYVACILCVLSVSSHEYQPMTRYDRVWESVTGTWGPHTIKYMKFDGTEEINGNTYHRIVTYKKTIMDWDSNGYGVCEFSDDVCENEGYLREEDGKVYTMVVGKNLENLYGGCLYKSSDATYPDQCEFSEQLVYDFNLEVDSCYSAFSSVTGSGYLMDFKVKSKSNVLIDGEECIKMGVCHVDFDNEYWGVYDIIESVGPIHYGCLNYSEFIDHPNEPRKCNYFNRLFDDRGNVLYETYGVKDYDIHPEAFSVVGTQSELPSLLMSDGHISYGEDNHLNTLKVYDANGRMMKSVSNTGRVLVSTSDLASGVYVCLSETDGKHTSHNKFIVK